MMRTVDLVNSSWMTRLISASVAESIEAVASSRVRARIKALILKGTQLTLYSLSAGQKQLVVLARALLKRFHHPS
jgi:ABC-type Mn2+/Zn2+ transport system ATPase subunit